MKENVMFIVLILSYFLGFSQHQLPKNPKPGKCYFRLFDIDKEIVWKEVSCADKKKLIKSRTDKKGIFLAHLKKLDALGYKVDTLHVNSEKNVIAHNKYLRELKKEQEKRSDC